MAIVKRESLADQVAEAIMALVVEQKLRPGDALPSSAQLAEQFGVSRTVVREATADLAGRGFVQRAQGREAVLSMPGQSRVAGDLGFPAQPQGN